MKSLRLQDILLLNPPVKRHEKEILLAFILGVSREHIVAHPEEILPQQYFQRIKTLFSKRQSGIPLAYLTKIKEFFNLNFFVNKDVLIPRPETELLVEESLKILKKKKFETNILIDIGTGSGCIPIAILHHISPSLRPKTFALDISEKSLIVAKKNARIHSFSNSIIFKKSNLLEDFLEKIPSLEKNSLLILTANLPYIPDHFYNKASSHKESIGILFEPKEALISGKDGLKHYRRLFRQLSKNREKLPDQIILLCEFFGDTTQKDFFESQTQTYFPKSTISIQNDLSSRPRMATIKIQNTRKIPLDALRS
ncbi:MAG: peptide chain release factor N(5)-glutamine methyltransferase [Candidatus Moraniibacteriota bacterium]|nr:MAG: peptide chain release factor N(5)-glutamine methyltransferase [Candidatus Moranbacteria bacterium]